MFICLRVFCSNGGAGGGAAGLLGAVGPRVFERSGEREETSDLQHPAQSPVC